ncbi:uncharacterized protein LOC113005993 isoform X2 [Solenopsis invicta]|uniref:uncharacterized protein LOC113005993 isoform X2 n=1 Tax=Solenopsis invicta TaxID=13686 RepID=UPI00193E14C6|nr:uncharacterized protein LOC113005993 isoform X2 [Solenopsis invicta]
MDEITAENTSELRLQTDPQSSKETTEKIPWPAYAEAFEVQEELGNEKNLALLCKICIGKKIIHASRTSTANLRKHLTFIIEDIQPLSTIDSPAFINFLRIGVSSHIRIMCRKTLKEKLCQTYLEMKSTLEKKLTEIEIVATTADLWSKAKKSYLGITIHWINPDTLSRQSAALACRRLKGRHTYDILADAIYSIFLEYHIQNKICCMTTDNGSNFVKAFQYFKKSEDDEDFEEVFHGLSDLLNVDDVENVDAENLLTLPLHHRCVSHTLNLVAVKDSEKALDSDAVYKKKHRVTFAKLVKLWNKQNQSTQTADKINEICGVYLKTPVITRWNSTFDCLRGC